MVPHWWHEPNGAAERVAGRELRRSPMTQRIGLFGGTFDPIHIGHLISARSLAEQAALARVILIPAWQSPHKVHPPAAAAADRLAMVRAAVQGDPLFDVSDHEIARSGPCYTYDTVREMYDRVGGSPELFWLVGADQLADLHRWHRAKELVDLVTIIAAVRPGWGPPPESELVRHFGLECAKRILAHCYRTPYLEISASDIRSRIASGQSVRGYVPDTVAEYIAGKGLYRGLPGPH